VFLVQLLVSGCSNAPSGTHPPPAPNVSEDTGVVRVMFATNRNLIEQKMTCEGMFGTDRATLSYGYCDVSIPPDHRIGHIESPSWLSFEFKEALDKHVVLVGGRIASKEDFEDQLYSYLQ